MPTRSAIVTGHVQGVGFRLFVERHARPLGIRGEVWNRSDGAVELEFEHEDVHALDELVRLLWTGPGQVRNVDVRDLPESLSVSGFDVTPTRR